MDSNPAVGALAVLVLAASVVGVGAAGSTATVPAGVGPAGSASVVGVGPAGAGGTGGAVATPTASCTVSERHPEPGEQVYVYAFGSENASEYQYDADGDGNPETDRTGDTSYNQSYDVGTYRPAVTAYNATTDEQDTDQCPEIEVAENAPPAVNLTYSPSSPTVGREVEFNATRTTDTDGSLRVVRWDFGDDGTYEETESRELGIDLLANRTYNASGTKRVRVMVEDDDGATSNETVEFVVEDANRPPEASLTYRPRPAVENESVTLDAGNSSDPDGTIAEYRWDLDGDGTVDLTSNGSTVETTYPYNATGPGYAVPAVTVVDDRGGTATASTDVRIRRKPPVARCSVSARSVAPGESVRIDASASENAAEYQYDKNQFGEFREFTGETTRTVTYPEAGNYTPRVRAWGPDRERSNTTDCPTVRVGGNQKPRVQLDYSPDPAVENESVVLDASNSTDRDGRIVEYRWDLEGDGTVDRTTNDSGLVTTYPYNATRPGSAVVVVTAVDDQGAASSRGFEVRIDQGRPVGDCSVRPELIAPGESVTIDARESEHADYYEYARSAGEFGDRTRNGTRTVTYEEPGNYTPRVRVTSEFGDFEDVVDCPTVTVREGVGRPEATLTYSPQPATENDTVLLDASGSTDPDGRIVEYRWDTDGDGTIDENSTDSQTTTSFPYGGGFGNAAVTVVDDDGATDTAAVDVRVRARKPVARCTIDREVIRPGEEVTVDAAESANADGFRYDVRGDGFGEFTTESTRTVTYEEPGNYTIRVRALGPNRDRSDEAECGTVTVRENNAGPQAALTYAPQPATENEPVTLDASGSTDPDGSIVEYRWDTDGDGTTDNVTAAPSLDTSYPYNASGPGYASASVTVVDDDGATATTSVDVEIRRGPPEARCAVDPTTVAPGEEVTIDAGESANTERFRYDRDGEGEFGEPTTERSSTVSYPEPGNYTPRVQATGADGERTSVADCPTVTVRSENAPPSADLSVGKRTSNGSVTLDASGSVDPDGRIVAYRWDFDGDGTVDRNTSGPTVARAFSSNRSVTVTVVDDGGLTASASAQVSVKPADSGDGGGLPVPIWVPPAVLLLLGAGGAAVRYRKLPRPRRFWDRSSGVTAFATGTFETPTGEDDTVTVGGLGFEPDLLVFTATNNVAGEGGVASRTDGWSYGKARRDPEGSITQNAISVADDAKSDGVAVATARDDLALDLLMYGEDDDGEVAGGLAGVVEATTEDGFRVGFDDSEVPADADEGFVVLFEAFAFADDDEVGVGHFPTPREAGPDEVSLGTDADYVGVTASNAVGDVDDPRVTDAAVGVAHGAAVDPTDGERGEDESAAMDPRLDQQVLTSTLDPQETHRNSYAAYDDRLVHLLYGGEAGIAGRTTGRTTGINDRLALEYDEVHAGEGGGPSLATYVAVDAGRAPAVGHFEAPAPGERKAVDVGFEPAHVSLVACNVDGVGGERAVDDSPLSFGLSHGTAMRGPDGEVRHHVLHSSVSAAAASEGPTARGRDWADAAEQEGGEPPLGAAAVTQAVDEEGRVLGRDLLSVPAFTGEGFEVEASSVSSDRREGDEGARPTVFYTAWPDPGGR